MHDVVSLELAPREGGTPVIVATMKLNDEVLCRQCLPCTQISTLQVGVAEQTLVCLSVSFCVFFSVSVLESASWAAIKPPSTANFVQLMSLQSHCQQQCSNASWGMQQQRQQWEHQPTGERKVPLSLLTQPSITVAQLNAHLELLHYFNRQLQLEWHFWPEFDQPEACDRIFLNLGPGPGSVASMVYIFCLRLFLKVVGCGRSRAATCSQLPKSRPFGSTLGPSFSFSHSVLASPASVWL